ncbi:hypothetical protein OUZ56_010789 [Daphnia magna]|uniref:THAP-type domain-containing protein n=1 Tax=Daphnia magna TaxID=35525 RepID=A0ABQ9YYI3_9CRUS|nr:hypothetical protein OUZ56_010789 [Daphnia magna]
MPACCVAYCKSDTRNKIPGQKCPFFGVPKKQVVFDEWKKVIPAKRKGLCAKSLVCYLHFEDNCIKKDLGNWRLKAGSIPTLRLKREPTPPPAPHKQLNLPVILSVPGGLIVLNQSNTKGSAENEVVCMEKLKLPGESWQSRKLVNEQEHPVIVCFETTFVDLDPLVRKSAIINLETKEIEYKVFQRKCPPVNGCLLQKFSSAADVERSLQYFNCVRTCPGITEEKFHELKEFSFPSGYFENGSWRSKSCSQLITRVKQDTENDLLKNPCPKCNKIRTTVLLPRLEKKLRSPSADVKNEYLSRDALLLKLNEIEKQIKTLEPTLKPQEESEMVMTDLIEVDMF